MSYDLSHLQGKMKLVQVLGYGADIFKTLLIPLVVPAFAIYFIMAYIFSLLQDYISIFITSYLLENNILTFDQYFMGYYPVVISFFLSFLMVFIQVIYVSFVTIVIIITVTEHLMGNKVNFLEAARAAGTKWGKAYVTGLLANVIIYLLTLLLVIPGIIWGLYYSFIYQLLTVKGLSGKKALNYSKDLAKKDLGYIFIFFLFFIILSSLGPLFITFSPSYTIYMGTLGVQSIVLLLSSLVFIYQTICFTLIFFNFTIRYRPEDSILLTVEDGSEEVSQGTVP